MYYIITTFYYYYISKSRRDGIFVNKINSFNQLIYRPVLVRPAFRLVFRVLKIENAFVKVFLPARSPVNLNFPVTFLKPFRTHYLRIC